jgi:hypothetical protein
MSKIYLNENDLTQLRARASALTKLKDAAFVNMAIGHACSSRENLVEAVQSGLTTLLQEGRPTKPEKPTMYRLTAENDTLVKAYSQMTGLTQEVLLLVTVLHAIYLYTYADVSQIVSSAEDMMNKDYFDLSTPQPAKAEAEVEQPSDLKVTQPPTTGRALTEKQPQQRQRDIANGIVYADAETEARIAREETEFWERYKTVKDHNGMTAKERDELQHSDPQAYARLPLKPVEIAPENIRHYKEPNPFGADSYDVTKFSKTLTLKQRQDYAREHGMPMPLE